MNELIKRLNEIKTAVINGDDALNLIDDLIAEFEDVETQAALMLSKIYSNPEKAEKFFNEVNKLQEYLDNNE